MNGEKTSTLGVVATVCAQDLRKERREKEKIQNLTKFLASNLSSWVNFFVTNSFVSNREMEKLMMTKEEIEASTCKDIIII